jgi:hypothetical protein
MWMRGVHASQLDLGICSQDGAKTAVVVVVDTSPHFASATPGTLYRNQQIIYIRVGVPRSNHRHGSEYSDAKIRDSHGFGGGK